MSSGEDRYVLWNYMLAEECLLVDSTDGTVLLTVTPRTLASALEAAGEGVWSPEDAEADFVAAVRTMYQARVISGSCRMAHLKSAETNEVPFAVGFLALSVLAAFHMRTDDEHTGRAFYPRLAEMLGCQMARSIPAGFDGEAFVELWEELDRWLELHYRRHLAAPAVAGARPFVAYPFEHVPLRQVDLERLPQFFDSYGYEPGARPPLDRIAYDIVDRSGPWRSLTESGQRALRDPNRRPLVVRQVARELERWDGCRTDSSGARSATIEVWMDIRRRRAHLALLARRPAGFPDTIGDGEVIFRSSAEGWYEPVPINPDDGDLLSHGSRIAGRLGERRFFLQLRAATVIPFTPSEEFTGLISDRGLRAETNCAVLCLDSAVQQVTSFLETIVVSPLVVRRDDTLPHGWSLIMDVRPTQSSRPPAGLEQLGVESSIAVVPIGGLRLGSRWTWLDCASSHLRVIGARAGLAARVDGRDVEIGEDGLIRCVEFSTPGQHVVEVGNRLRQRVTVLSGTVSPECWDWPSQDDSLGPLIAVPAGHWTILGTHPTEHLACSAAREGALVRPAFRAIWAVHVEARRGATVLHLHDRDSRPTHVMEPPNRSVRAPVTNKLHGRCRWAESIYQAAVRRPRLLCARRCTSDALADEWAVFVRAARSTKRALKRRTR